MENDFKVSFLFGKKQEYTNCNANIEEDILKDYAARFNYDFTIEHNSSDYTTLKYKNFDIIRLKYGTKSKWIKIYVTNKKENIDNPLFAEQKNKNELYWKSNINCKEDLSKYDKFIEESIKAVK